MNIPNTTTRIQPKILSVNLIPKSKVFFEKLKIKKH